MERHSCCLTNQEEKDLLHMPQNRCQMLKQDMPTLRENYWLSFFGIKRFRTFKYGRHFTVITDHKPPIMILNKNLTSAPARLQRMILDLQEYGFTIDYRPGKEIPLPDLLSRLPNPENKKH